MAYQATVIPIMIASPGDVAEEREIVRSVIHDWNDVNAQFSKVMLAAVCWETHSSPELGCRPQELINTRILNTCDLLVGVFWTRLGTPTGEFQSGTVEEIKKHVAAGRPAMIYFSSKPVAPESIDHEQYKKVIELMKILEDEGLIERYDNVDDFRKKLTKQLQLCLSHNKYIQGLISSVAIDIKTDNSAEDVAVLKCNLSDDAKQILKAAAKVNGVIRKIAQLGGTLLQAGNESFGGDHGRESAKWVAAFEELEHQKLVVGKGHKGELFEITHKGWEVADAL